MDDAGEEEEDLEKLQAEIARGRTNRAGDGRFREAVLVKDGGGGGVFFRGFVGGQGNDRRRKTQEGRVSKYNVLSLRLDLCWTAES